MTVMKPIRLLDLGRLPPIRSQTIYHAVVYPIAPDLSGTNNSGSLDRLARDCPVYLVVAVVALQEAAYDAEPARAR